MLRMTSGVLRVGTGTGTAVRALLTGFSQWTPFAAWIAAGCLVETPPDTTGRIDHTGKEDEGYEKGLHGVEGALEWTR
ncbi:MAG: hypothetical protein K6C30_02925 [Bacteroidaceae bacterium]|nr:hypothetical protein [Bacteroidaceae bacterium]